ncbi:hypothetical protein IWZ01DRAFT_363526 [Phyllosticta capitalensis]
MDNQAWSQSSQYYNHYQSAVPTQTGQAGPAYHVPTYGQRYNENPNWQPAFHGSSGSLETTAPLMLVLKCWPSKALVALLTSFRGVPTQQLWPTAQQAPRQIQYGPVGGLRGQHESANPYGMPHVDRPVYIASSSADLGRIPPSAFAQPQAHGEIIEEPIEEPEGESPMEQTEAGIPRAPEVRVGCPYFLKAPHAQQASSACRAKAFQDISRLKDHLVKIHDRRIPDRMTGEDAFEKWRKIWDKLFPETAYPRDVDPKDRDGKLPKEHRHWTAIDVCEEYVLRFMPASVTPEARERIEELFEDLKSRPRPI